MEGKGSGFRALGVQGFRRSFVVLGFRVFRGSGFRAPGSRSSKKIQNEMPIQPESEGRKLSMGVEPRRDQGLGPQSHNA